MKKKLVSLILCLTLTLSLGVPVFAAEENAPFPELTNTLEMDTAAFIKGSRTYTPARFIAEAFGIQVLWDGQTQRVALTRGLTEVFMQIGSNELKVTHRAMEGNKTETVTMDEAPVLRDNRTLLPVRYWAEAFGLEVDWDVDTQTVTVSEGDKALTLGIGKTELSLTDGHFLEVYDQNNYFRFAYPTGGTVESARNTSARVTGAIGNAEYEMRVDITSTDEYPNMFDELEAALEERIKEGSFPADTTLTKTTILGFPAYVVSQPAHVWSIAGGGAYGIYEEYGIPAAAGVMIDMQDYYLSMEVRVTGLSDADSLSLAEVLSNELTSTLTPLWIGAEAG